ncbi:hypothetical protein [Pelosinus propionicus]|uniref:Uncharacterized protein n=1 Tax=Pelosinus propionicus DSM 13327 TaxID=1123291 RepID=A0A1I4N8J3_9FIRM|nr:hypothetical protein [Pelosinus propionicus]SFM11666.1 hypothetical protein SAMN04490355_104223 [Pelosinus propionicus DSM 13327]
MKGYERLQTIIGREINGDELSMVATIFKTSMEFFCQEESISPWIVEPEPIGDAEHFSPIEMINCAIKKYVDLVPLFITSDEQQIFDMPNSGETREYQIVDFKGYVEWARRDDGKYAVDPEFIDKFLKLYPDAMKMKLIEIS